MSWEFLFHAHVLLKFSTKEIKFSYLSLRSLQSIIVTTLPFHCLDKAAIDFHLVIFLDTRFQI